MKRCDSENCIIIRHLLDSIFNSCLHQPRSSRTRMVRALRAIKGSEEEHHKKDRFWDKNDSVHFRVTWRAEKERDDKGGAPENAAGKSVEGVPGGKLQAEVGDL